MNCFEDSVILSSVGPYHACSCLNIFSIWGLSRSGSSMKCSKSIGSRSIAWKGESWLILAHQFEHQLLEITSHYTQGLGSFSKQNVWICHDFGKNVFTIKFLMKTMKFHFPPHIPCCCCWFLFAPFRPYLDTQSDGRFHRLKFQFKSISQWPDTADSTQFLQ